MKYLIRLSLLAMTLLALPLQTRAVFSDLENVEYQAAVLYAAEQGIVNGYPDGSFRPNQPVNRAEFTKILIEATMDVSLLNTDQLTHCFTDVTTEWFSRYICAAKQEEIVNGYPDNTFRPDQSVNVVEAAKIIANAFDMQTENTENTEEWYLPFLKALEGNNALPPTLQGLEGSVSREEMVEMIWRIREEKNDQESITIDKLIAAACLEFREDVIPNVDMESVRAAWISWMNAERATLGLHPYTYNEQLNRTAFLWSRFSADRDQGSHKRPGQIAYYDYNIITQWFRDLGLEFANVYRVTYSENIGWWPYRCSAEDCTQQMINTVRHTFDGYMREKGRAAASHYNSMTNRYFNEIGMGIVLSDSGNMYITTHYATKITSDPLPICK